MRFPLSTLKSTKSSLTLVFLAHATNFHFILRKMRKSHGNKLPFLSNACSQQAFTWSFAPDWMLFYLGSTPRFFCIRFSYPTGFMPNNYVFLQLETVYAHCVCIDFYLKEKPTNEWLTAFKIRKYKTMKTVENMTGERHNDNPIFCLLRAKCA